MRAMSMRKFFCDICGKELEKGALRYEVKIEVKAAYDTLEINLLDLLKDHPAFAVDHLAFEGRGAEEITEDLHGNREVLLEDPRVVAGVFACRERVQVSSDRLHPLGDLQGRAMPGALEHHVLDEVGDAAQIGRLVPGAGLQPDPERETGNLGKLLHKKCQA